MSTTIRPELSEKNPYWIERHRYYELKHFCLQYPLWKKAYLALDGLSSRPYNFPMTVKAQTISDPTAKCAEARLFYVKRMEMIEQTVLKTDAELTTYILKAVTEGWSYESLQTRFGIPCCRDTYYDRYRRFFYFLNKERQ